MLSLENVLKGDVEVGILFVLHRYPVLTNYFLLRVPLISLIFFPRGFSLPRAHHRSSSLEQHAVVSHARFILLVLTCFSIDWFSILAVGYTYPVIISENHCLYVSFVSLEYLF